jgi:hypothetical protein
MTAKCSHFLVLKICDKKVEKKLKNVLTFILKNGNIDITECEHEKHQYTKHYSTLKNKK